MPYITGATLREKIDREGELPIGAAVRIIKEVTDALDFAHSQGVVHRDIKPDNIMLAGNHAIVADFGVAKAVSEATGKDKLTTAGVALGTPTYMAPEQATADPHIDHRADIYAIGVMAYELLAGRAPFAGATPQAVLAAHVTAEPDTLRTHRSQVSVDLEAWVMRCLAKKPADRWQSAAEMLPHLESLDTSSGGLTPTDTRPISAARQTPSPTSKKLTTVLASIVVLAGAAVGGSMIMRGGGPGNIEQIAILPIMDLSGSDDVFVTTVHDALVSAVAQTNVVGVISRSAVLQLDGVERTEEIARRLGVQAVMEGSVFRAGERMRINVQLVEPTSLRHLWTQSYERDVTDVLEVQGEIVRTIAGDLSAAFEAGNIEGAN